MTQRRLPNHRDLAPLLQWRRPVFNPRKRALSKALTVEDLRRAARRRTPRAPFDYADGAAEGEISLARARQAFSDIEFHPSVLRDVAVADTSTSVLGRRSALPFGLAPTGFTRMLHTEGELAGVGAAAAAGIPFALSTVATTSIEDIAAAAPDARRWFQLYMWRDRARATALIDRAAQAGFEALLVTVDTPIAGARLRDTRNGMTIPPAISLRTVMEALPHPGWWFDFLTTEPLAFASMGDANSIETLAAGLFDPSVTYEDLAWIRERWPGKLVLKGVQTVGDATRAAEAGVDAVLLSNHGGRQLDRAPVPLHLLPEVVREIGGTVEIHLDTGITHGADVVAALALGADFTLIGRAWLYGLMAGGRAGVDRTIAILVDEIQRTMRLLGVTAIDELRPDHVTLLQRLSPVAPRRGLDPAPL